VTREFRASDADRDPASPRCCASTTPPGRLTVEEFHEAHGPRPGGQDAGRARRADDGPAPPSTCTSCRMPRCAAARPAPGQSLPPGRPGPWQPGPVHARGTVAMGAWAVVTSALVAIWAVAAVVGTGTWFPWWALIALPWIWAIVRRSQRPRRLAATRDACRHLFPLICPGPAGYAARRAMPGERAVCAVSGPTRGRVDARGCALVPGAVSRAARLTTWMEHRCCPSRH